MGLLVHVRSALKHALDSFMNVSIIDVVENEKEKRAGRNSRRVTNGQYGWALHEALKLYHKVIIVNSCDYDGRVRGQRPSSSDTAMSNHSQGAR
jgi:hypothetical protein